MTDADKTLLRALHQFAGAGARWDRLRQQGADDVALREAVAFELGHGGGFLIAGLAAWWSGGRHPKLWTSLDRKGPPALQGLSLIAAARGLLDIPMHGKQRTLF